MPSSSKYSTLDDLVTYNRKWDPNVSSGIDLNEDTPCMGAVDFDGNLYAVIKVAYDGVRIRSISLLGLPCSSITVPMIRMMVRPRPRSYYQ